MCPRFINHQLIKLTEENLTCMRTAVVVIVFTGREDDDVWMQLLPVSNDVYICDNVSSLQMRKQMQDSVLLLCIG